MTELSIIIPSRLEKYLKETIEDILAKAVSNFEIIVILDGYWITLDELVQDERVKYLHNGKPLGMRESINRGMAIAKGKYVLKTDAHCMFGVAFDNVLIKSHRNRQIQIPTRKRLDPEKWSIIEDGRRPINYMKLNEKYKGIIDERKNNNTKLDIKSIDEINAFQGSCWFMRKRFYESLGLLDYENWGPMGHEAQEIYFKAKESGGKVVRNKLTWYAHWHKNKEDVTFKYDRKKSRLYMEKFIKSRQKKDYRIVKGFKRRDLAKLFKGIGVEIGVRQGKYSEVICQEGQNVILYSIDPWDLPYRDKRSAAVGIKKQLEFYKEACERLKPYECNIIKKESLVAVQDFRPESINFAYIDGSHQFDYVMPDIIEWAKRVKPGGIVSGHDYYKFRDAEVVTAVDTYCKVHKIEFKLTDEYTPSWWFVKQ